MLSPNFQRIIYEQKEHELMQAIERKHRIAEAGVCLEPAHPWYVRLGQKLFQTRPEMPAVETCYACCAV